MNKLELRLLEVLTDPIKEELKRLRVDNKELKEQNKKLVDVIAEISISNSKVYNSGRPMMEIPRAKKCECEYPIPIADLNQDENGNITHSLCDRCSGIISNAT